MSGNDKRPLVPRLRFAEFRDAGEWSFQPLSQLAKRSIRKNVDGQHSRVLTNSAEQGVVDQRDYFDKDIANQGNLEGYYIVEKGDYVYNPRISSTAPVGPISRNNIGAGVMSPLYTVFRFDSRENDFYAQYFRSNHWHRYLRQKSSTGARHDRMSITNDDFMGLPLPVSSPTEQQKIADCLSLLDERIEAEANKLYALKTHKRGLMQELFPADGETVPRRRFPEFRDAEEWEEITLASLGVLVSGLTYSPEDVREDGLLVLRSSNIKNGKIDLEDCVYVRSDIRGANPTEPNDILVCVRNGSSNLIGKSALIPPDMPPSTHGAFMTIFRSKNAAFVYQLFHTVAYQKQVAADLGATINSINGAQLLKYKFFVPNATEQIRIADCLSSLDDQITAQGQQMELLKLHKKGLMQRIFPVLEEVPA